MNKTLGAPSNFRTEAGDCQVTAYFDEVEGADGYLLNYYLPGAPGHPVKSRRADHSGKTVLGFANGQEYLVSVAAFVMSENGAELLGESSEKLAFTPISMELKAQGKLCLEVGETARIEWEYQNTRPEVIFESTNPEVVRVDQTGAVIALAEGDAMIVTAMDEERFAVTSVSVGRGVIKSDGRHGCIAFTGDLMCAYRHQRDAYPRNYDFTDSMSGIRERLSFADVRVGVLETIVCDALPYEFEESRLPGGAPNCNSPSSYLKALRSAGFDVLVTANNHNCDGGAEGLKATVANVKREGMANSGTYYDNPVYLDAGGIRVALISLCMINNGREDETDDSPMHRNIGRYSRELATDLYNAAKSDETDYVVFCMHWGNMNSHAITGSQVEEAGFLADMGADLIVGSHPHLLQEIRMLETSDGRKVPCAFSLGNFITTMDELKGNRDSVALVLRLTKKDGVTKGMCSYVPFYSELRPATMKVVNVDRPVSEHQTQALERIRKCIGPAIGEDKPRVCCIGSEILSRVFENAPEYDADLTRIRSTARELLDDDKLDDACMSESNAWCMIDFLALAEDYEFEAASDLRPLADKIRTAFGKQRVILLRLEINDRRVVHDQLRNGRNESKLNETLRFVEQAFIELVHPCVIDVSGYYFGDSTHSGQRTSFEPCFYEDVRARLKAIFGGSPQTYHYERNDELWLRRVIRYYDNCEARSYWNWLIDGEDAAGMLIMNTSRQFVLEHQRDVLRLLELRVKKLERVETIYELSDGVIMAARIILDVDAGKILDEKQQNLMLKYDFSICRTYAEQLTNRLDYPVSKREIPEASKYVDDRDEYVSSHARRKANVDIWGSCVTRTAVTRNEDVVVGNYVFKQPQILAFSEPMNMECPTGLEWYENNAWRMRTIMGSVRHDGVRRLSERSAEWLLVDFYDLITEVCKIDDDYLELDDFIRRTAFFKEIGRGKKTSYLFDEIFDREGEENFYRFTDFVNEKYGKKVILIRLDLKDTYVDLDGEVQNLKFDPAFADKKKYIKKFEDLFIDKTMCKVIDIARDYVASDAFPLGGAHVVHYEDAFYEECCRRISRLVGLSKSMERNI